MEAGVAPGSLKVIHGECPASVRRVSRESPRLPQPVWIVQLRLHRCVQIVDSRLPHNPKCHHPRHPLRRQQWTNPGYTCAGLPALVPGLMQPGLTPLHLILNPQPLWRFVFRGLSSAAARPPAQAAKQLATAAPQKESRGQMRAAANARGWARKKRRPRG